MWTTAILVLLVVCFFYLFVAVDPRGTGPLSKIRNFLYVTAPGMGRAAIKKMCGQRALDQIDRLITYVCFSTNPIVQILYVLLAGGGSGSIKTGQYLAPRRSTSFSELHLALLQRMGLPIKRFGETETPLPGLGS